MKTMNSETKVETTRVETRNDINQTRMKERHAIRTFVSLISI